MRNWLILFGLTLSVACQTGGVEGFDTAFEDSEQAAETGDPLVSDSAAEADLIDTEGQLRDDDRDAAGYGRTMKASAAVAPPPATCSGTACDGTDPETTGCAGAYASTVATKTAGALYIELRWSSLCQTNWARVTDSGGGYVWGKVDTTSSDWSETQYAGQVYTKQEYCPTGSCAARACGKATAGGATSCTTWR